MKPRGALLGIALLLAGCVGFQGIVEKFPLANASADECDAVASAFGAIAKAHTEPQTQVFDVALPTERLNVDARDRVGGVSPPPMMGGAPIAIRACDGAIQNASLSRVTLVTAQVKQLPDGKFCTMGGGGWISRPDPSESAKEQSLIYVDSSCCSSGDLIRLTRNAAGRWVASNPQRLWFSYCTYEERRPEF